MKIGIILFALALISSPSLGQTAISNISHTPDPVGAYQKLEITFDLGVAYSNPYDPDIADVRVEFTSPSSVTRTIPAFWFEGYNRSNPGGNETFTANGINKWMARLAGTESGVWSYRILVTDANGNSTSPWQTFTCNTSSNPGFVRIDPRDNRFMVFDNGQPYNPIGENICWGGGYRVIDWQSKMEAQGMNWGRYWISMHTANQPLEWIAGGFWAGLGRYSQQIACRFDAMLDDAYSRGIYIQLCMDSFNAWNYDVWANWADNPYNLAQGGMLTAPIQYLTNAEAKALAKKRFRYIAARWAWNPAVLTWEFFNEVDIMGAGGAPSGFFVNNLADGAAWHQEMAQYIRSQDPYEHLRTTSFSNQSDTLRYPEIWNIPEMDIIQVHRYSDASPEGHIVLLDQARAWNKPAIVGEWGKDSVPSLDKPGLGKALDINNMFLPFGPDWLNQYRSKALISIQYVDPTGQSLHDAIWGVAVEGSGAMSWWWDNWIDPGDLYPVFAPLSAYMNGEDWAQHDLNLGQLTYTVTSGQSVNVFGSSGWNNAYLWVRNPAGTVMTGLTMNVGGFIDANKQVEFWNTATGTIWQSGTQPAPGGTVTLAFPDFNKDMAVKIVGAAGQPTPTPGPTATPTPLASGSLYNPGAETGDLSGWVSWEEYPYDQNGPPVDYPGRMRLKLDINTNIPAGGRFHTGNHAFGSDTGWHSARGGMYQIVNVIPGHTYRLSLWGATGPDDESLRLGWLNGTYTWITDAGLPGSPQVLATIGDGQNWTQLTGTFIPTVSTITVYCDWRHEWATGIGSVYVDDWSLVDLSLEAVNWESY